jgi:hypothetical protein
MGSKRMVRNRGYMVCAGNFASLYSAIDGVFYVAWSLQLGVFAHSV